MFNAKATILSPNQVVKYQILRDNKFLSFKEVIEYWETSDVFNDFFNKILIDSDFAAFFWETPPMNITNLGNVFEFALVKSSSLEYISADAKAFQNYFSKKEAIVTFPNLRGDAQLVVPCPISEHRNYPHLATFIRSAPLEQTRKLWKTVAQTYRNKLQNKQNEI